MPYVKRSSPLLPSNVSTNPAPLGTLVGGADDDGLDVELVGVELVVGEDVDVLAGAVVEGARVVDVGGVGWVVDVVAVHAENATPSGRNVCDPNRQHGVPAIFGTNVCEPPELLVRNRSPGAA